MIEGPLPATRCRLDLQNTDPMLEFVAFTAAHIATFAANCPIAAGEVLRGPEGRPQVLHFAPRRWLICDPAEDMLRMLESAVLAKQGAMVDVTGKWQAMTLRDDGAERILAHTIDLSAVLVGRNCAAVTLFDCPALIARADSEFPLWVQASYAADFAAMVHRLAASMPVATWA